MDCPYTTIWRSIALGTGTESAAATAASLPASSAATEGGENQTAPLREFCNSFDFPCIATHEQLIMFRAANFFTVKFGPNFCDPVVGKLKVLYFC